LGPQVVKPRGAQTTAHPLDGTAAPTDSGKEGGHTKLERRFIPGPAGKLEALLEWDPQVSPRLTAVVCHPHPLYGGTLHNKVVFHAAKGASQAGLPTLRFNFRGVGKSQGAYDGGKGEQDDVRAAIDYLSLRFPATPVCVIGFSFGAWVGLNVGATDRRVAALVGLGIPVAAQYMGFLRDVRKPKLIVQGTEDLFGPKPQVEALFAEMPEPKRLHWVQGADHFFTARLSQLQEPVRRFLEEVATSQSVEKRVRA
jgi:hypothetical protein